MPEPFSVEVSRPTPHLVAVTPSGEADLAAVPALLAALTNAADEGAAHVLVDLDALTFFDASTLGLLVLADHRAAGDGSTFLVRCGSRSGRRLFALTGLGRLLEPTTLPGPGLPPSASRAA